MSKRRANVRRAKKKIGELLRKGTPFNIRKVSTSTVQTAANVGDPAVSQQAKGEIKRRIKGGIFR